MRSFKYLLIHAIAVEIPAFADNYFRDSRSLRQEILSLKLELKMLRGEKNRLGKLIESDHMHEAHQNESAQKAKWGCYIDDIRAGVLYGVGNTMAEAKSQVLQKCAEKDGTSFESNVKCSNE